MESKYFYKSIINFIKQRHPELEVDKISETDNLFDLGYIDSLSVTEFILFLEKLLGREIPIGNYEPRTFHNMKSLFETFCDNEVILSKGDNTL